MIILYKIFYKWYESQSLSFKTKCVFIHENTHHMLLMPLVNFRSEQEFVGNFLIFPPASPDLTPIKNLWATRKKKFYVGGRQHENLLQ